MIQQLGQKVCYDSEGTGYIMLDVTKEVAPLEIMEVDGQKLLPKDEYHCTLVATPKIIKNKAQATLLLELVKNFLTYKVIGFKSLDSEIYVCRKEAKITVIAQCDIEGLNELSQEIQQIIPDYAPPFPHVTLLKNEKSQYGIAINSYDDFVSICQRV